MCCGAVNFSRIRLCESLCNDVPQSGRLILKLAPFSCGWFTQHVSHYYSTAAKVLFFQATKFAFRIVLNYWYLSIMNWKCSTRGYRGSRTARLREITAGSTSYICNGARLRKEFLPTTTQIFPSRLKIIHYFWKLPFKSPCKLTGKWRDQQIQELPNDTYM